MLVAAKDKLLKERSTFVTHIERLKCRVTELKINIASLDTDKWSLNAEISTKCADISTLKLEIEDKTRDVNEFRTELEVLKEDHAAQIELLRTQIDILSSQNSSIVREHQRRPCCCTVL